MPIDYPQCNIASARLLLEASGFTVSGAGFQSSRSPQTAEERDEVFTLYCSVVVALVLIAGLMSGLTLGLMSLDTLDLEVCPICLDYAFCCKLYTTPITLTSKLYFLHER